MNHESQIQELRDLCHSLGYSYEERYGFVHVFTKRKAPIGAQLVEEKETVMKLPIHKVIKALRAIL